MPPRTRKTTPTASTTPPVKKATAKKPPITATAKATARKPPPNPDPTAARDEDVAITDVLDAEPMDTQPTGARDAEASAESAKVLSSDRSSDSSSTTHTAADGSTVITTRSSRTTRTLQEYGPGHTVDETVTVGTERVEKIPVPYAGPASDHPAPVG